MTDPVDQPDPAGHRLAKAIRSTSPEAAAIVDEHLEDYDEVLPTVLLGDVARWYRTTLHESGADGPAALRVATRLGELFEGEPMETIVATGFLENMPHPADEDRTVVEHLPDNLRAWLARMESWRPAT